MVDLAALTFCESSGISALLRCHQVPVRPGQTPRARRRTTRLVDARGSLLGISAGTDVVSRPLPLDPHESLPSAQQVVDALARAVRVLHGRTGQ
ncbi:hypothetical protein [Streptomyces sp. NPDC002825]|uniref:hypothetical protein n=1 Tax=Streptomyces sp. NPDC002825 TaxID=3154666 RepID=UPI00331EC493